ncbi:MAG: hypothetical protein ACK54F_13205 [Planctomycetia bacterium]|jgi:hypothetical protein
MKPLAIVLAILAVSFPTPPALAADGATDTLPGYLGNWKLDRAARAALEEGSAWSDAKLQLALRIISRLGVAPADAYDGWASEAAAIGPERAAAIGDRFVKIEGRAIFIAPLVLPAEIAEIVGRKEIDVVRLKAGDGMIVDVLADAAPKAWPRWRPIDEAAAVIGLAVSIAAGPVPAPPPADGVAWPVEPAAILVVARRVAWYPATPLGGLGMDYGLFDTVADGQKLVGGDTEAFYGMLAAVGRGSAESIEAAAGPPADIMPLLDPKQRWFADHRGDPITVDGVARRATRIAIDDPVRRRAVGADHYWELFVFVPTSLIKIGERLQESYPIVCCVRSLPNGMPTGQNINERVRVSGFAMKRYAYPLPKVKGEKEQPDRRQETPLVIGRRAAWVPEPSTAGATSFLGWIFAGLAALIGLLLAFGAWRSSRDTRRRERSERDALPERISLPERIERP